MPRDLRSPGDPDVSAHRDLQLDHDEIRDLMEQIGSAAGCSSEDVAVMATADLVRASPLGLSTSDPQGSWRLDALVTEVLRATSFSWGPAEPIPPSSLDDDGLVLIKTELAARSRVRGDLHLERLSCGRRTPRPVSWAFDVALDVFLHVNLGVLARTGEVVSTMVAVDPWAGATDLRLLCIDCIGRWGLCSSFDNYDGSCDHSPAEASRD